MYKFLFIFLLEKTMCAVMYFCAVFKTIVDFV